MHDSLLKHSSQGPHFRGGSQVRVVALQEGQLSFDTSALSMQKTWFGLQLRTSRPKKVVRPVGAQLPHSAHWSHFLADSHDGYCAAVRNARPGRIAFAAATAMAPMARRREVVRAKSFASASK